MEFKKADQRMKELLCGKKFIFLPRMSNRKEEVRCALKGLFLVNRRLYKAHLLKKSFHQLWSYSYKGCAFKFWQRWKGKLNWNRLQPYKKFARMLDNHLDGILILCEKKVSPGYIERANLKAGNIIRGAYSCKDKKYMRRICSSMGIFRAYPLHHNLWRVS